jgi:hypothetical protein
MPTKKRMLLTNSYHMTKLTAEFLYCTFSLIIFSKKEKRSPGRMSKAEKVPWKGVSGKANHLRKKVVGRTQGSGKNAASV